MLPEHVLFRRIENDGVLFNIETDYYYSINEVSCRIIEELLTGNTISSIVKTLMVEYEDADQNKIESDIQELIEGMRNEGLWV